MRAPLAERMRPKCIDEVLGQEHLVGENGPLRRFLENRVIPSMIFWGPPGVGKTTLAQIIAESSGRSFYKISAIDSGVKVIRDIIAEVKKQDLFTEGNAIVFIDEIHRFSKSQQDSLLDAVEKGILTIIGATTENPSFEVNSALLSRCQVFVLQELDKEQLDGLIQTTIESDEFLSTMQIEVKETDSLIRYSGGDARKLLNGLEAASMSAGDSVTITNKLIEDLLKGGHIRYDKNGEAHYDIISAFIKSIRGSDPNAAVYWLARMVEGGEDPKFIARRLLILAAEDIGLANPNALLMANSCFQAVSVIGWPESRIILSECAIYLANSPKSNSAYKAINKAQEIVKQTGNLEVPLHLRNAPTSLMKDLSYGEDYLYPHDHPGSFKAEDYLPEDIKSQLIYEPGDNKRERNDRERLSILWKNRYEF